MGEWSAGEGFQQRPESHATRCCRIDRSVRRTAPVRAGPRCVVGFSVTEVEVEHHHRLHGKTKYGLARFWRGFFDLGTVKFHHFVQPPTLPSVRRTRPLLGRDRYGPPDLDVHPPRHGPAGVEPSRSHHRRLFEVVAVQLLSFGLLGELLVYLHTSRAGTSRCSRSRPHRAAAPPSEEPRRVRCRGAIRTHVFPHV